jgi:hypothetical protein
MRALTRLILAPMFVAAAILTAGTTTHLTSIPAQHSRAALADPICPAGTSWDDGVQGCV